MRTASGQILNVDGKIASGAAVDAVIVLGPFFGMGTERFIEWLENARNFLRPLLLALRRQHRHGAVVASVCSGSFLLAEAGLLDGRAATTHWSLATAFRRRYPQIELKEDEILTERDNLLSCAAVTSYFNLALRLVEKFAGAKLASLTARILLIDINRVSQASYRSLTVQAQQAHNDPMVEKAQLWMEKHLRDRFRLAELADVLAVSERTLIRRFNAAIGETPLAHMQALRIEAAKRLIEGGKKYIDSVSDRVGYVDRGAFRRLFKRETGLSPREYQQRFTRLR